MRNTPTETVNLIPELNVRIYEGVLLQDQIEELTEKLKSLKASIESDLERLGQSSHTTADGYQAVKIPVTARHWVIEALEKILNKTWFERLCPRKPETAKLSTLLELLALPPDVRNKKIKRSKGKLELPEIGLPELRACSRVENSHRLELHAPAKPEPAAASAQAVSA
jgi:hypothetical protein